MKMVPYDHRIYGDLSWYDAPNDVKMSVYIKNRTIPIGWPLNVQLILYNTGASPISVNTYIDAFNTGKISSCLKDTMENVLPGHVAYEIWTIKTQNHPPGDYQLGFYCEPKGGGYYAAGAGRVAVGMLIGIAPGKSVGGFSTRFRIAYGVPCPKCGKWLQWLQQPRLGWYCDVCRGFL